MISSKNSLLAILICNLFGFSEGFAKQELPAEYGIALTLEGNCIEIAERMNYRISQNFANSSVIKNTWHVTLYQAVFKDADVAVIKHQIQSLKQGKLKLVFSDFYVGKNNRSAMWRVKNIPELQNLHKKIVDIASKYYIQPVGHVQRDYTSLSKTQKQKVDKYGMSSILEEYDPHMTLFYAYSDKPELKKVLEGINLPKAEANNSCKANKIVIAKLGGDGNVIEIVQSVDLL
jgi:2'-5' RNA ligase